jgi:hypothetical protein
MRMPILTYILVVGAVLFGGLVLVSSQLESKPLPVSQRVGVPPPFKALPDDLPTSSRRSLFQVDGCSDNAMMRGRPTRVASA